MCVLMYVCMYVCNASVCLHVLLNAHVCVLCASQYADLFHLSDILLCRCTHHTHIARPSGALLPDLAAHLSCQLISTKVKVTARFAGALYSVTKFFVALLMLPLFVKCWIGGVAVGACCRAQA
jgi:hypothetical protein